MDKAELEYLIQTENFFIARGSIIHSNMLS